MNVRQLIKILEKMPPTAMVILQKDAEGNGYSPLRGADADAVYLPASTYHGSVYSTKWTADDACLDEKDWEKLKAKPHCVVLFPIN